MKWNKFGSLLVIGLVLTVAASGCRKRPVGVTNIPGARTARPSDVPGGGALGTGAPMTGTQNVGSKEGEGIPAVPAGMYDNWIEDKEALKADTVYFDFDSSVLKATEKPKVSAVADYLKSNSGKALRVEGNCDERGTEEYNRSLGERRALAVREELVRLGIDPIKVVTKTWGKDNPSNDPGHDEAAWKKNRRDEFIVLSPPAGK